MLELRSIVDVESVEQIASIQGQSLRRMFGIERILECAHVRPHRVAIESDLVVTPHEDRALTELSSENVQRLVQRGASPRPVRLRPEEGEQLVPPVKPARAGSREVCDERSAAGSAYQAVHGVPVGCGNLEGTEHPQLQRNASG
jgi:hypothetical protein